MLEFVARRVGLLVRTCGAVKALRLLGGGVAPERSRRDSAQNTASGAGILCGVGWSKIGGVVLMWHWEHHLWDCGSEMRYACGVSGRAIWETRGMG